MNENKSINRVVPIWTPQDSVDTAQAFAAELHNAEYVGKHRKAEWLFSRSRFRKSKIMDFLAVALLFIVLTVLSVAVLLLSTGTAKAEPGSAVIAYAQTYGGAVCSVLSNPQYHSTDGVMGVLLAVEGDGFTAFEAGEVVGIAVAQQCPRNLGIIQAFVNRYGTAATA